MKNFTWLLVAALGLTSCMGTKKYASFVEQRVQTEQVALPQLEALVVNAPATGQTGNQFKQLERSFIPALVYWGWNSTISCELDPGKAATSVRRGIYQAADKLNLQDRLAGRQLVVDIRQTPGQFMYVNKGSVIFLIFAHITSGEESITPRPTDLVLHYQLLENGTVIASGEEQLKNTQEPLRNLWKSSKKFTWLYLEQFDQEASRMGEESLKNILLKLEGDMSRL
ncbi:hypothetical protein [Pontibacter sp. HSC-36F09]|uniref:hypothetical protein n=1 Tax=Pontibacter sp. HSC-36F09 TaxID=2910966 RepID=UPI0020A1A31A|nr:hypothetical protein [Pontibacter sp. HSC-36F09]MCP2044415.1 hypothetical protein [Pontibacter sp. HSC-36F09]